MWRCPWRSVEAAAELKVWSWRQEVAEINVWRCGDVRREQCVRTWSATQGATAPSPAEAELCRHGGRRVEDERSEVATARRGSPSSHDVAWERCGMCSSETLWIQREVDEDRRQSQPSGCRDEVLGSDGVGREASGAQP